MSVRRSACPTPRKRRFRDWTAATVALERLMRTKASPGASRVYECRCGGWHLTSQDGARWGARA